MSEMVIVSGHHTVLLRPSRIQYIMIGFPAGTESLIWPERTKEKPLIFEMEVRLDCGRTVVQVFGGKHFWRKCLLIVVTTQTIPEDAAMQRERERERAAVPPLFKCKYTSNAESIGKR